MTTDARDEAKLQEQLPGFRFFWDFEGKISRQYGALAEDADLQNAETVAYRPFTLVLDPNLRVIATIRFLPAEAHNAKLDEVIAGLGTVEEYAGVKIHAPVLIVPRVFDPEFCRLLIEKYKENGGKESGFMREKDGKTIGIYDDSFKKRSDYYIQEEPLVLAIRSRIRRFLLPEIKRAFQYNASRALIWPS